MASHRLVFSSEPPQVDYESCPIPVPGPGQILIRNRRTQVSAGSETNFLRHGPQSYGLPPDAPKRATIGYMASGRIEAVGAGVTGWAVGDRVASGAGHAAYAVLDVTPATALERIPDGVSDDVAGFMSLGDVALHGVRRAQLQIGQSVAVFGLGIVGQLVLQLARISGAFPLIAIDLVDERLELAKRSGATHVINPAREDVVTRVKAITGGGAEAVFHCAQAAAILQTAMECAADRGAVILTGSPPGTATIRLKEELLRKELRITGTYQAGLNESHVYWRFNRSRNRRTCLELMATGALQLAPLLTHVVPASQAAETYRTILAGSTGWLGVVFKWD